MIKLCEYFDQHYYRIEDEDGTFEYYPSTTTKLNASPKPFLATWRGDIGNREAEIRLFEAGERGKRIHFSINLFLNGGTVIYNPYQRPNYTEEEIASLKAEGNLFILQQQDEMLQVIKFQDWYNVINPIIVETELTVYDEDEKEAGTIDIIADIEAGTYEVAGSKPLKLEGGRYVVDIKSSKEVYDEAYLQLSSYRRMYNKRFKGLVGFVEAREALVIHTNAQRVKKGIAGLMTHLRTSEELDADYEAFRHIAAIWDRNNTSRPKYLEFPTMVKLKKEIEDGNGELQR